MSTDSIKRAYVSVWGTKVSVCGIRLKEKSEDIILFVGFESHMYPFTGDYFPLKGNNFPLIPLSDMIESLQWEKIFTLTDPFVGYDFPKYVGHFR